ncbi:CHAT domain-containing protein [Leptothoe kymatousa]|uniref:CHAT domain-containing protein n=1 Tax=Leptothoe kymatousa TAU-MAC 1615 TaxID=2364775 RepID=A0ABS5Y7F5_9CYAN|nr:CHAT domain-containing protein [Leptothoe kymatousa]MBT9313794.1 CHAT domain-containing protein [Leptothoe kymatousa TAU-MAC 1615]
MVRVVIDESGEIPGPDLAIIVRRDELLNNKFRYTYILKSSKSSGADLFYRPLHSQELGPSYQELLNKKFDGFNKDMRSKKGRQKLNYRLRKYGQDLYRSLFDHEFDDVYWHQIKGKVKTIQVVSKEPIPWELIFPVRLNTSQEVPDQAFFCEQYDIAHWFPESPPEHSLAVGRFDMVKAISGEFAQKEQTAIQTLLRDYEHVNFSTIHPSFDDVLNAFSCGCRSILHLICHGVSEAEDADTSILKLEDDSVTPDDLRDALDENESFLVFLNGCETGIIGPGVAGLGGWAYQLATRGNASAMLGTIMKVPGNSACEFAISFYQHLYPKKISSSTVGSASEISMRSVLKAARIARKELQDDPTRLSYKVYGNPMLLLNHDRIAS